MTTNSDIVSPDGSVEQISAIIHEQGRPPSLATGMRKAACALFLVCLDEAGDDVKKIDELNALLNSFLDNYDTPA